MLTAPISHLGGGAWQEIPSRVLGRLKVSMRGLPESSASAFPAATQLLLRHGTDRERRSCVMTERGLGGSGRGALSLSKSTWQRITRRLRGKPGNKSWGKGKTYPPHTTTSQIHAVNSETLQFSIPVPPYTQVGSTKTPLPDLPPSQAFQLEAEHTATGSRFLLLQRHPDRASTQCPGAVPKQHKAARFQRDPGATTGLVVGEWARWWPLEAAGWEQPGMETPSTLRGC